MSTENELKNRLHPHKPVINNLGVPTKHVEILRTYRSAPTPVPSSLQTTDNNSKNVWGYFKKTGGYIGGTMRFAATTGIIFVILFVAINFPAYYKRFEYWQESIRPVNAEQDAEKEALESHLTSQTGTYKPLSGAELKSVEDTYDAPEVIDFENMAIYPSDFRLIIPKLKINVPIVDSDEAHLVNQDWGALEKQIQDDLRHGIVHYPATAMPGEIGNVFLTGHSSYYPWDSGNYKDVFATLDQLVQGDEAVVYQNGIKYVYRVYDIEVVEPRDTWVLNQPDDMSMMTLMTCTPVGTNKNRLIIQLQQITPDPVKNSLPNVDDGAVRIQGNLEA